MQPTVPNLADEFAAIRRWSQRGRAKHSATINTIPFIIGSGSSVITTGIQAAVPILQADKCRVTGVFIQEFDGTTGSINLDIQKAVGGSAPVWTTMLGSTALTITNGRCYPNPFNTDQTAFLATWASTELLAGDYVRLRIITVSLFKRLSVALRVSKI